LWKTASKENEINSEEKKTNKKKSIMNKEFKKQHETEMRSAFYQDFIMKIWAVLPNDERNSDEKYEFNVFDLKIDDIFF